MPAPEFSLAGKRALITGAGRGLGAGVAEVFAEAGCEVVVNALTETYLAPLAADLNGRGGGRVIGVAGDCATAAGAEALAAAVAERAGPIDILVNAVGDSIRAPFAFDPSQPDRAPVTDQGVETVMALNLMAAVHVTRRFAPQMLERGAGRVINITASHGVTALPQLSVYAAAKAGLEALTQALAREWAGRGLRVNAIAPGVYPPPETTETPERAAIMGRIPTGRFGRFREVGLLALYLASEASDYMTGQVIALDGGLSLTPS